MICTEAYKEHIEYTFNVFCYAAVDAWRKRERQALNRDNKFIKMKWHGNTYINISNIHSIHIFKTV